MGEISLKQSESLYLDDDDDLGKVLKEWIAPKVDILSAIVGLQTPCSMPLLNLMLVLFGYLYPIGITS